MPILRFLWEYKIGASLGFFYVFSFTVWFILSMLYQKTFGIDSFDVVYMPLTNVLIYIHYSNFIVASSEVPTFFAFAGTFVIFIFVGIILEFIIRKLFHKLT